MATANQKLPIPPSFSMEERLYRPQPLPDAEQRLRALAAQARDDIELLEFPKKTFPYERKPDVLEVAIVGGGQTGLGV